MANYRHGDLGLILIEELPKNLIETKTNILMKGNNGHDHSFNNGTVYIIKNSDLLEGENFTFGYFVAKNTKLYHEDHGDVIEGNTRSCVIEDGIYELVKQKEYTAEGLKVVID